jgi:hypothetical protein
LNGNEKIAIDDTFRQLLRQNRIYNSDIELSSFLNFTVDDYPVIYVDSTGNDSNIGSPGSPLKTIQAALSSLVGHEIKSSVTIRISGTWSGFSISGFQGGGVSSGFKNGIAIDGGTALATLTTGVNAGTAGFGTNSTTLVKPGAAANWTVNNLRGKFVKITSGAAAGTESHPVLRPILSNTTTNLTIHPITGLNDTSVFEIVEPNATITEDPDALLGSDTYCALISDNDIQITLRSLKFSGASLQHLVYSQDNREIILEGCVFDVATLSDSVLSKFDGRISIKNCVFTSTSNAEIQDSGKEVLISGVHLNNGRIRLDRCQSGNIQIDAINCVGNAFYASQMNYVRADINANSCTATPVYMENVSFFEPIGTYKLSGSSNTGVSTYGVEINKAGRYNLIGCTLAGAAGDILLDNVPIAWATLTDPSYGVAQSYGTTLVALAGQNQAIVNGAYSFTGQVAIGGRLLSYGFHNMSQITGLTATGTDASTALVLGQQAFERIDTVAAGTGVRLTAGAILPGVLVVVSNNGANTLTVYPPAGGTIDGLASVTINTQKTRTFISSSNDGLSFLTIAST